MSKSKALAKLPTLEDCSAGLQEEWKTIHALAKKTKYRTIAVGLWLLKAQEIYRVAPGSNQGRSGGKFTDCPTVGQSAESNFDAWLASASAELGFGRSSGYNWINAALNAGLTPDSTLEDVKALETKDALADRKLAAHDLYAPPRLPGDANPKAVTKALNVRRPEARAQQTWFGFYQELFVHATDEKDADLLYHLPLTTIDPEKEVSLTDLEQKLELTLSRVREIKAEKASADRAGRRGRGRVLDAETGEDAA